MLTAEGACRYRCKSRILRTAHEEAVKLVAYIHTQSPTVATKRSTALDTAFMSSTYNCR
jgi:hypothetical protein